MNKKIIIALVISALLILFTVQLYAQKDSDFEKLQKIAREHCMNEDNCYDEFNSPDISRQKLAQEKSMTTGHFSTEGFDPDSFISSWNFNNLPEPERSRYYRETDLNGSKLREYWIVAEDKNIEIAPGVYYPAWTYNGQVPAPTIRATEGDTIRIHFLNKGTKAHTMHFHGFHPANMDGSDLKEFVYPGENFTYEFGAEPFGLHLYHCHSLPLKQHISKGLYGAYIVDPKNDTRPAPAKEFVMVMNAFDTDQDGENEVYAVNTQAFYYAMNPIKVKKGELVRIYLANLVEFDPVNSFHLHANFFDEYKTGTKLEPNAFTDTLMFSQGERSILDVRFKYPGRYMFHAHVTEFTELGWMGFFEVEE